MKFNQLKVIRLKVILPFFYTVDYQPNVLCGRVYGPKVHCMELLDDDAIINGCMMIFKK